MALMASRTCLSFVVVVVVVVVGDEWRRKAGNVVDGGREGDEG